MWQELFHRVDGVWINAVNNLLRIKAHSSSSVLRPHARARILSNAAYWQKWTQIQSLINTVGHSQIPTRCWVIWPAIHFMVWSKGRKQVSVVKNSISVPAHICRPHTRRGSWQCGINFTFLVRSLTKVRIACFWDICFFSSLFPAWLKSWTGTNFTYLFIFRFFFYYVSSVLPAGQKGHQNSW